VLEREDERARPATGTGTRIALKVLYWLAVLLISVAILVGLILLLESRDQSSLDESRAPTPALRT
jgi:hypothetical protein